MNDLLFKEGDIFYTILESQYHLFKVLKNDSQTDTLHLLSYKPSSNLPGKEQLKNLEISVFHFPIDKNGFTDPKLLMNSKVDENDLTGYFDYLKQTNNSAEIAKYANAYYKEAYALTTEKKFDEAIQKYSLAIDLIPSFYEAIDNRAFCKMDMGKLQEAIEDFKLSLSKNPDSMLCEFSIGECHLKSGNYPEAKKQFEKAVAIDPTNKTANEFLKKANDLLMTNK